MPNYIEQLKNKIKNLLTKTNNKVKEHWNNKTDDDILFAYHNAIIWIDIAEGSKRHGITEIQREAERERINLDTYVIPQMQKRKLRPYPRLLVMGFLEKYREINKK